MSETPQGSSQQDQTHRTLTHAVDELSEIVKVVMSSQETQLKTQNDMQRRDLRWRNVRMALFAISFIAGPLIYSLGVRSLVAPEKLTGEYAAMVRVEGEIDSNSRANATKITRELENAFEDEKAKGVIILINSPGGSPVQSSIVHDRIMELRKDHPKKKVWAVGEDMMTSGAYFIAVAAPNICVNRSTMTGSIGVVTSGWGMDKAIGKLDIERRVFTAGLNKARLDTFRPLKDTDLSKVHELLDSVHHHFIDVVKEGRGDRLKGDPTQTFSGDYWTGDVALRMGLVDDLCDVNKVLHEQMGADHVKDFTQQPSLLGKLATFGVLAEQLTKVTEGTGAFEPRLMPW